MVWIFLAESGDLQLHCKNGSSQLHIARSNHTAKEFSLAEWQQAILEQLQSGTMSHPFRWSHLQDKLISSTEDFHVRTFQLQVLEKAWEESEADCFSRSCAWPKKSSPNSYSLKTCQPLQVAGDFKLLEKLPRWGMIADGVLYPLQALEHYTKESDGSCWPTPQARAQTDTPAERKRHTPCLESAVMMYPTPRDNKTEGYSSERFRPTLHQTILQTESNGKRLCPRWVSVLMGYPTTWTDLEAWAMQWFQNKRKKRLKS